MKKTAVLLALLTICFVVNAQSISEREKNRIVDLVKQSGISRLIGTEPSKVQFVLPVGKVMKIDWWWGGTLGKRVKIEGAGGALIKEVNYHAGESQVGPWMHTNASRVPETITVWCWFYHNNDVNHQENCAEKQYADPSGSGFYIGYSDTNDGKQNTSEYTYAEAVGKFTW